MGTSIGLNLVNFFSFFAFKSEKFHLSLEKRDRTAKLSVPTFLCQSHGVPSKSIVYFALKSVDLLTRYS